MLEILENIDNFKPINETKLSILTEITYLSFSKRDQARLQDAYLEEYIAETERMENGEKSDEEI